MRSKQSLERWRRNILIVCVSAATLAGCGDSGGGDGGGGGGAGPSGDCADTSDDDGIRIHIVNSEDVANIRVTVSTPAGSCFIDPLPVSDELGLELGQAVYELEPGDVITFGAQSPSGGAAAQCRVTEMAVTDDAIFVDLFITTAGFICSMGVEPVSSLDDSL